MTDRNLRTLVAGLAGLLAVVIAIILLLQVGRGGPSTAGASPSPSASASARLSASPSASASASARPSARPTPSAPASAAPTPSATPLPSVAPSVAPSSPPLPPLATATFLGLKLDATAAPGAQQRIVTFSSDGPGTITAKLASSTPGTTQMCLRLDGKQVGCKDWASGTMTGKTTKARATWQVTLIGGAVATPKVDLTLTFQALAPSVKIEHARFDGTAFPDTNGIQVRFSTRGSGGAQLVAAWGGHPFLYEIDLFDESTGAGDKTFPNQGPSTNVDQTFPLTAGNWRIVLQNSEAGFGVTNMTAVFGWP